MLGACAIPGEKVAEEKVPPEGEAAAETPSPPTPPTAAEDEFTPVPEPPVPAVTDHGLRLPADLLSLPGDGEFRATSPTLPERTADRGPVISRPPTEPPPRPKPQESEEPGD